MLHLFAILTLAGALCGCPGSTTAPSVPPTTAPNAAHDKKPLDLAALVGHHVRLEGRFDLSRDLADAEDVVVVIVDDGEQIYLPGKIDFDGRVIPFRRKMIVEGTLGHRRSSDPPSTQGGDPKRHMAARPPDGYFIENAKLRMVPANPADARAIGMTEERLRAVYEPTALDHGVIYWGGSGCRRIYFQLDERTQVWFEMGSSGGDHVTEVGAREPKTNWVRHGGDSITVE